MMAANFIHFLPIENLKTLGDSLLSWVGSCQVKVEYMVDGEDLNQGAKICGNKMLHFIWEKFNTPLSTAVAVQRLVSSLDLDTLRELEAIEFEINNRPMKVLDWRTPNEVMLGKSFTGKL
ncbi:MAG: DUF366 family protein [Bdellovibrionaceae bacterium]|nr:DUF366 family protein [Pseudobdellovibrionaceae bacterium]